MGHPAPGVHDQPSVAALVASYDQQAMKYNAYTTIQPPRLETIDQLQYMVQVSVSSTYPDRSTEITEHLHQKALDDFGKEHGAGPERLVFFRDGLSEGEYVTVAEKEIKDIKGRFHLVTQSMHNRLLAKLLLT